MSLLKERKLLLEHAFRRLLFALAEEEESPLREIFRKEEESLAHAERLYEERRHQTECFFVRQQQIYNLQLIYRKEKFRMKGNTEEKAFSPDELCKKLLTMIYGKNPSLSLNQLLYLLPYRMVKTRLRELLIGEITNAPAASGEAFEETLRDYRSRVYLQNADEELLHLFRSIASGEERSGEEIRALLTNLEAELTRHEEAMEDLLLGRELLSAYYAFMMLGGIDELEEADARSLLSRELTPEELEEIALREESSMDALHRVLLIHKSGKEDGKEGETLHNAALLLSEALYPNLALTPLPPEDERRETAGRIVDEVLLEAEKYPKKLRNILFQSLLSVRASAFLSPHITEEYTLHSLQSIRDSEEYLAVQEDLLDE